MTLLLPTQTWQAEILYSFLEQAADNLPQNLCALCDGFQKKPLLELRHVYFLATSTVIPNPVIKSTILTAETVEIIALLVKISCYCSDSCQECFKSLYYVFQVNLNWIFIHSTSLPFWSKDVKIFPFTVQPSSPAQDFLLLSIQHKYYTTLLHWALPHTQCTLCNPVSLSCKFISHMWKKSEVSQFLRNFKELFLHQIPLLYQYYIQAIHNVTSFMRQEANTIKHLNRLSNHFYFSANG